MKNPRAKIRRCRECGCTDARACSGGCSWATADLCSKCAPLVIVTFAHLPKLTFVAAAAAPTVPLYSYPRSRAGTKAACVMVLAPIDARHNDDIPS